MIRKCVDNGFSDRGTCCLNFGFSYNYSSKMIATDALQMVEPPIHLSGIAKDSELKLFGIIVHDLLLDFEGCAQKIAVGIVLG